MRKLSCKWPVWLSIFGFLLPIFYLYFRIGKPEIFSATGLAQRFITAITVCILSWGVYGILCLLARSRTVIDGHRLPQCCLNCMFSEKNTQATLEDVKKIEDMKCNLTGYNYTKDYTCQSWKIKRADDGDSGSNIHETMDTSISSFIESELDKKASNKNKKNIDVSKSPSKASSELVVLGCRENCANCERIIGNLEKSYSFNEHVVCSDCYDRLTAQASSE